MKKGIILLSAVVLGLVILFGALSAGSGGKQSELVRIHIRANSNSFEDQQVKYAVKEQIVQLLTPLLSGCTSKKQAEDIISKNISSIERSADAVLKAQGFSYKSDAGIFNEFFPTRSYEDVVVESGYYDALIVNLGSAQGDNWWCVVYPPLCFLGSGGEGSVQYKSVIQEWIKKLQSKG